MMIDIYVVNAFSKDGAGGNTAGVAITNMQLTEHQKTDIASRLGYSETAFVSQSKKADFKLEYFTTEGEVPLCGHATIGTFVILNQLNLIKKSHNTIETKSGLLNIRLSSDGKIFIDQNLPQYFEIINNKSVEHCFDHLKIDSKFPIQIVSTGLKDILVPIYSTTTLERMVPNFSEITKISKGVNCIGIHAFSLINTDKLTAICRNFAPLYGINEESATGTSSCALACYLFKYGLRRNEYIFEQGYNLNSISRIYVRIESCDDIITNVSVGGNGYLVKKISIETF